MSVADITATVYPTSLGRLSGSIQRRAGWRAAPKDFKEGDSVQGDPARVAMEQKWAKPAEAEAPPPPPPPPAVRSRSPRNGMN